MARKPKALALFSGGLDSILAIKLVSDQNVNVEAMNFALPFLARSKKETGSRDTAKRLGVPVKIMGVGGDYVKIVRNPQHGYGKNMNPCIDCKIFMLKKAKKYARETRADFIFTGEVLDQRPMSQHKKALDLIEKEAGLTGRILRPLSARLLPETEAEKKGWIERQKLLDIDGRSRSRQIQLAKEFSIADFPSPAGGCLLTDKAFSGRLRDLLKHKKRISSKDIELLKLGRHFRFGDNKIIVGRNENENRSLLQLKSKSDYFLETQGCGSPITLLQGRKTREAIRIAAALTVCHSDQKTGEAQVKFGRRSLSESIAACAQTRDQMERMRIK